MKNRPTVTPKPLPPKPPPTLTEVIEGIDLDLRCDKADLLKRIDNLMSDLKVMKDRIDENRVVVPLAATSVVRDIDTLLERVVVKGKLIEEIKAALGGEGR
jgi:hypothetical protein